MFFISKTFDRVSRVTLLILFIIGNNVLFTPKCLAQKIDLTLQEQEWIKSQRTLIVANELDWPPFDFVDENKPAGYSIDLINLIAKKTGLKIDFVNGYNWNELINMFKEGEIDILPAVYKDEERSQYMGFTSSYFSQPTVLITNSNSNIEDIVDLNDKTVGVIDGFSITTELEKQYPKVVRISVNGVLDGLKKVSTGEVDGFIESIGVVSYYLENQYLPNIKIISDAKLENMDLPSLYIGVRKENNILRGILQKGLDNISQAEMREIRTKWITIDIQKSETSKPETLLTAEEIQWLSNQSPMKVANEMNLAPFNFSDKGEPKGYSIELIQLASEKTGLPIEFVAGNTWDEIIEKFKHGELDILPYVYFTEERQEFISFTESYESNPSLLVVNERNTDIKSLEDLSSKQVAVVGGSTAEILKNRYPNIKLVYVDNPSEGLKAVSAENVDGFIASLGTVSYFLSNNFIPNIKLVGDVNLKTKEETQIHIGVAKERIILRDILQKGLDAITQQELNNIRQKWLPFNFSSSQEKESFFKVANLLKMAIGALLLFAIAYFVFNWLFSRVIKEEVALEFGSRKFKTKSIITLGILVLTVAGLGFLSVVYIQSKFSQNIKLQLENDLNSAHGRLEFWLNQKKDHLKLLGHDEELVDLTKQLLRVSNNYRKDHYEIVHNKLEEFFKKHNYEGSFIINSDLINIGSEDTAFVGKPNPIANYRADMLGPVFNGEVVFIPPVQTMMYFVIPIEDTDHTVIAALIQQIDPAFGFSEILQLSHVGETGESYIFNKNGKMLSRSRFEKDLQELGVFKEDSLGILSIEIKNPGGNLTTGFEPLVPRHLQPLTYMANSAISGNSGVNVDGYNDYRGVKVMGAWQWIDNMELGLATEIDTDEALALFSFIRLAAIIVIGITLIFIIGAILFTLKLGEKANFSLLQAKYELEERVDKRTEELNQANQQIQGIVDSLADALIIIGEHGKIESFSPSAEKMFHYKAKEILGLNISKLMPSPHKEAHDNYLKNYKNTGKATIIGTEREVNGIRKDGSIFPARLMVSEVKTEKKRLFVGLMSDLTARKKAEKRIISQSTALKSTANGIVITNTDGEIEWVNPAFTKLTGYSWREAVGKNPRVLNSGKHDDKYFKNLWETISKGDTWHGDVINKKKNGDLYYEDMTITPILDDKQEIVQYVAVKQDVTERKKLENELEKANKRMSGELNVAKDIQMSLLPLIFPAFPQRKEIDLFASLIPAREVGGDFYDFYFLDDDNICLVVGDVSGKGVPAALMMAVTKTLLKSRAGNDKSTASILTHVNNEIARDNTNYMFITVFMAILNTNTGELVYSNAGHNPTFIINKDKTDITKLTKLHGPVIGAMEEMTYTESRIDINKGDMILAYTDGVTEAQNKAEELYSDPKFENLIKTGEYSSPEILTNLIIDSVKTFEDGAEQFDDITVLAVQFNEDPNTVENHGICIEIKNDLVEITSAIEQFESFGMEYKIPFPMIQKFNIVFDELLNNIISYGYDDEKEHNIEVDVELKRERMIITLTDDGIPFNPFKKDPPDTMLSVEERGMGGLGIHIVKNLVDEYKYKRNVDKNIITLIKFNINK
jgi:PAS domain S-box-containing protein